jgi:hypothetical protein
LNVGYCVSIAQTHIGKCVCLHVVVLLPNLLNIFQVCAKNVRKFNFGSSSLQYSSYFM